MTQPILDGRNFQIAGALQPFNDDTTSLLQKADPVIFFALDFWTYIIRTYPGPALVAASQDNSGLKDTKGFAIDNAVLQAYPYDIVPYLPSAYVRFPCLAVYRKSTEYQKHSAIYYTDYCKFDLIYILPPLTPAQAEGVLPILHAVENAVKEKTVQSLDPGYAPPGGQLGQTPWGLSFAAVQQIGFETSSRGHLEVGNEIFPYVVMSGFFKERDMYLQAQNQFSGVDITADLVASDGTRVPSFMQVSTQRAPSIASVTPGVGPITGGTTITIAGALFLSGAKVLVGTQPALNIVVASNGLSITCTTPSVGGSGAVDITVTNPDGQVFIFPTAFFFGAPAFLQVASNNSLSSLTSIAESLPSPVTKGSTILVFAGWGTPATAIASVSDGVNTYHPMTAIVGSVVVQGFAAYNVPAGSPTVTVTWAGSVARPEVVLAEYANLSSTPLDTSSGNTGTSQQSTASVNTTGQTELLAAYSYQGQRSTGIGSGWTERVFTGNGFGSVLQDIISGAPGLYTATTQLQASAAYAATVAALHT